ncbi:MAG TPA: HAMP domain-containing sensor histidine kinase [Pseudobdellovibrionaceae bacterium]|nr:HAMP domain-containing sensor histidine kinase [Pseudobdellovibrionaceae bacterium]
MTQQTILWIGPEKDIESSKTQATQWATHPDFKNQANFLFESIENFIEILKSNSDFLKTMDVLVLNADSSFAKNLCFTYFKEKVMSALILNTQSITYLDFRYLINSHCNIYFSNNSAEALHEALNLALFSNQVKKEDHEFRMRWLESKRNLENQNQNLELVVQKRTEHIDESHQEERLKLIKQRQLIKFMQDLATLTSLEEILLLISNEIKKFHFIGSPVLSIQSHPKQVKIYLFHHRQILQRDMELNFQDEVFNSTQGAEDLSHHLANLFGRPFGKMVHFQLKTQASKSFSMDHSEEILNAYLSFESQMDSDNLKEFNDFIADRTNLIGISIDRIFYETALVLFSYRWSQTFEGVRDQILIIDNQFNILKSNRRELSDSQRSSGKCYEVLFNLKAPCENCPQFSDFLNSKTQRIQLNSDNHFYQLYSYPIWGMSKLKPEKYVNYYSDVTIERKLYMNMVQTEKMSTLGLLAGNIAHELNNPLSGIRALTQIILSEKPEGVNFIEDLLEIEKAAARCQKIIKNLLDFSLLENQTVSQVNVSELVQTTLPLLKIAMRSHKVLQEYSQEPLLVSCESQLLQQVVFNLVNNALQAMKEAGTLSIHTYQNSETVFVEICDTGTGVPLESQDKLFQPFFTTKEVGVGTGLGLSFSRSVIERFGGSLYFQENIPKGSCFVIEMPRSQK